MNIPVNLLVYEHAFRRSTSADKLSRLFETIIRLEKRRGGGVGFGWQKRRSLYMYIYIHT